MENSTHGSAQDLTQDLTPKEIVAYLDNYIIGQNNAKKAVAIALRNRSRRKKIKGELQKEISPKNIIMIGNTGVGKTEIARRIAALSDAPFIKVEATKFTEIGYVGRDVESMIRDLLSVAINNTKKKVFAKTLAKAETIVEEKILDALLPNVSTTQSTKSNLGGNLDHGNFVNLSGNPTDNLSESTSNDTSDANEQFKKTREKFRQKLRKGDLEEKEIEVRASQMSNNHSNPFDAIFKFNGPMDEMKDMGGMIKNMFNSLPQKRKNKKLKIKEARKYLLEATQEELVNHDEVIQEAIYKTENFGIVFLDEIDKIVSKGEYKGAEVSREGVQRDILPLIEGSSVNTKYGLIKTDHILFIAAGAFHISSPADIIPELQGRFPIRVELESLTEKNLEQILVEPKNSLLKQYIALLETEGITLNFNKSAIKEIAKITHDVNVHNKNLGARRLSTVMEKLLEEILFEAPGITPKITINDKFVKEKLSDLSVDEKLSRYIL